MCQQQEKLVERAKIPHAVGGQAEFLTYPEPEPRRVSKDEEGGTSSTYDNSCNVSYKGISMFFAMVDQDCLERDNHYL